MYVLEVQCCCRGCRLTSSEVDYWDLFPTKLRPALSKARPEWRRRQNGDGENERAQKRTPVFLHCTAVAWSARARSLVSVVHVMVMLTLSNICTTTQG